jgi:8-oxo-dGTP pyrophosphatase MutT (NUDIX family)
MENGEKRMAAVQPRAASTVMLLREEKAEGQQATQKIEVFMVRRVVQSEFMPDLYVFPGGSVMADDRLVEQSEELCRAVLPSSADPEGRTLPGQGVRAAAIRELFEEANVLLAYHDDKILAVDKEEERARFALYRQAFNERRGSLTAMAQQEQLTLATDRLVYFSHWITPEGMPKRYDTHFFLAAAPTEQEALYDDLETSEGVWISPAEALARFAQGIFPVAFPTFHQLHDLAEFDNVQQALNAALTRYVPTHSPILTLIDGFPHVYLPEDAAHPWKI